MSIDLSQFHQVFFEESFEGLQAMEASLLELDCDHIDSEAINCIFRAAHSIKGSSSTFGFTEVAEFTHVLETLLDQVREGSRDLTRDSIDLLLLSVDCLHGMLTELQAKKPVDTTQSISLIAEFNAILNDEDVSTQERPKESVTAPENNQATESKQEDASSVSSDSDMLKTWHIHFIPEVDILRTGNEPARMIRELSQMGDLESKAIVDRVPDFLQLNPESCYIGWDLYLTTLEEKDKIEEIFEWVADESEIVITKTGGLFLDSPENLENEVRDEDLSSENDQSEEEIKEIQNIDLNIDQNVVNPAARSMKPKDGIKSSESTSIRVSIEKIDSLVNLVGELVITQSMLGQLGSEMEQGNKINKLQEGLAQLEHNTRELQESVMRIRMLPISFTFSRFPRMVRDLSKQLGKNIELKLSGENTELDKTVMEKIGDPLVHLVRNSLDHGLEMPEERLQAGKPKIGTVELNAFHQGGNIIIEIIDDGQGLNREKIQAKAIANNLITEHEVLTDEQIQDLVFQPGFSTADAVTDVSGRGVGMDVVRRNIQELNGAIEVKSVEGVGSTFTIRLPLTLAILDGQLVQVGKQTFIVPLVSIVESLQPDLELINNVAGGCDVFRLRNEYIPIINLWEVFGITASSKKLNESLLVVVELGNTKVALVVDDLLGQQQVVIKSMETNYKKVEGISGATILGDGTVSLILDITDLIHIAGVKQQTKNGLSLVSNQVDAA